MINTSELTKLGFKLHCSYNERDFTYDEYLLGEHGLNLLVTNEYDSISKKIERQIIEIGIYNNYESVRITDLNDFKTLCKIVKINN